MAIAIATSDSAQQASSATLTKSFTVSSGTDRKLVVAISSKKDGGGGAPSGVTWNGTALAKIDDFTNTSDNNTSIWYLDAPESGTHNIVITYGAAQGYIAMAAYELTGSASAYGGTNKGNTDVATSHSITVTVEGSAGIVIDTVATGAIPRDPTVGAGQTAIYHGAYGSAPDGLGAGSSYEAHSGSNVAMSWTSASATYWGSVAVEFIEGVQSDIKTIMDLAKSSCKTVNDLAIASVKSINDLS
jgi:hypothetical protein